jgi:hypothetical protein
METLRAAYAMAKANDGAPGSDGVSFEAIEEQGVEGFLEQIRISGWGTIDLAVGKALSQHQRIQYMQNLNGELGSMFKRGYPDMQVEELAEVA